MTPPNQNSEQPEPKPEQSGQSGQQGPQDQPTGPPARRMSSCSVLVPIWAGY